MKIATSQCFVLKYFPLAGKNVKINKDRLLVFISDGKFIS